MRGNMFRLIMGAIVVGALLVFAAMQLIGTERNQGRLAKMADQSPTADGTGEAEPVPEPQLEPVPDMVSEEDDWYGDHPSDNAFEPEPFDPSPQNNDLPPEDLRFAPTPEPGMGEPAPAGE